jgi:vancomycin resistance protein YoaR
VLVAAAVVGGLLLLWVVAAATSGGKVARGTTVLGVGIGGMTVTAAEERLDRELGDRAAAAVAVDAGGETEEVRPDRAGLALDSRATAEEAARGTWNPVTLVGRLFGTDDVPPVVSVDRPALREAVAGLAGRVDGPPKDGGVRFVGGEAVPVEPVSGRELDREGSVQAIEEGYLTGADAIELPTEVTDPEVDSAEVRRAIREFARPAMSAPVVVRAGGKRVSLAPSVLGPALRMVPDQGTLEPEIRPKKLAASAQPVTRAVERPARDASFRIVDGKPRVVPGRAGRTIKPESLAAAVLPALTRSGPGRTVEVAVERAQPDVTTAEARGLGVKELLSEYTTYYPSTFQPRLTNIHRAADLMDETLLLPGEVFSLNGTVGERTKERGFAAGYVISGGRLAVDYGGGVSQLATTTFNAAFFAGLEDVEHHPHSFYISRYPEGREATVAWGLKDLRFRNDSPNGVLITTSYTSSSVTVRMWGTKRYRIEAVRSGRTNIRSFDTVYDPRTEGSTEGSCVAQEGVPGFTVTVTRLFYQGGKQVKAEPMRTTYAPEDRLICGSSGPPEPDPEPEPDNGGGGNGGGGNGGG